MTTPTQKEPLQLTVSNFGPIAKAEIDLRPLTVFVGPSNTGKSYLAILIYALHSFFGGQGPRSRRMSSILRRRRRSRQPFDDDSLRKLADWIEGVLAQIEDENSSAGSPIQLPDFVGLMVRSLFSDLSNFSESMVEEIKRSFGIKDAARLIRHGSGDGAKIISRSKPFTCELTLKRGNPEGSVILDAEETPLYIDPHVEGTERVLLWGLDVLNAPVLEDKSVEYFIRELSGLVLSNSVSPLNEAAHYLPADRTGVMRAHRVVVVSLIERAPYAGLRPDITLPTFSGVLADFLQNLLVLDDSDDFDDLPEEMDLTNENLAASLEQHILKGKIHNEYPLIDYPMFSYQPQGWEEELPLMNTSSMVSELAPVVLYLRHLVEPGDVLIIEEPESHLHPKMQVEFIRQLAAVVRAGIRVMLTTHSEWVLDELANLVRLSNLPKAERKGIAGAEFALDPAEVGVWLFEPKQQPRGAVVKEIPLDVEFGGFRSGFDDVALGTYNDYAEISNRIESSK